MTCTRKCILQRVAVYDALATAAIIVIDAIIDRREMFDILIRFSKSSTGGQ